MECRTRSPHWPTPRNNCVKDKGTRHLFLPVLPHHGCNRCPCHIWEMTGTTAHTSYMRMSVSCLLLAEEEKLSGSSRSRKPENKKQPLKVDLDHPRSWDRISRRQLDQRIKTWIKISRNAHTRNWSHWKTSLKALTRNSTVIIGWQQQQHCHRIRRCADLKPHYNGSKMTNQSRSHQQCDYRLLHSGSNRRRWETIPAYFKVNFWSLREATPFANLESLVNARRMNSPSLMLNLMMDPQPWSTLARRWPLMDKWTMMMPNDLNKWMMMTNCNDMDLTKPNEKTKPKKTVNTLHFLLLLFWNIFSFNFILFAYFSRDTNNKYYTSSKYRKYRKFLIWNIVIIFINSLYYFFTLYFYFYLHLTFYLSLNPDWTTPSWKTKQHLVKKEHLTD